MTGSPEYFGTRIHWQTTVLPLYVVHKFPPRDPSYGRRASNSLPRRLERCWLIAIRDVCKAFGISRIDELGSLADVGEAVEEDRYGSKCFVGGEEVARGFLVGREYV